MKENKNIPIGYKDTPVGVIPEDWKVQKIVEITNYVDYRGRTPKKSKNGIYLLTAKNIKRGYIDYEVSKEYISEAEYFKIMNRGLPQINDIVITTEAPLGNVAIINNTSVAIAQRVIKYTPKDKELYYKYFKYYLLSDKFQTILIEKSTGSTAKGIKGSVLHKLNVILPPLSEQKKIADILSTWDDAIEAQSKLVDKFKLRKQALMQQLLTGKKRLKGFDREWKEYRLGEIFERVTRKNNSGNTNIVTISAQRGFVKQNDYFNKTVASEILDNYFLIYKGEFCYNKSYSNGYPLGATKRLTTFDSAVVTTLYICFKLIGNQHYCGNFFEHLFEANLLNKGLLKIAHEGGRAHGLLNVTSNDFFNIRIKVPTIEEQIAIANILSTADKETEIANVKLDKLHEQKKGLMQQLLTGKKRVTLN